MIEPKEFLDLYFAIMALNDVYSINVEDMTEVIKILYSSSEFELFVKKLNIESLSGSDVEDHPLCDSFNSDGIIDFTITEEEKNKILARNINDTTALSNAIAKRAMVGFIDKVSNGVASLKYDDPNGTYRLTSISRENSKGETKLFTDGNIISGKASTDSEIYDSERIVRVNDSTYTIMIDYVNGVAKSAEIRGNSQGGLLFICYDVLDLLKGFFGAYESKDREIPKSYVIVKH